MDWIISMFLVWAGIYIGEILKYLTKKEGEQEEKLRNKGAIMMAALIIATAIFAIKSIIEAIKAF